MVVALLIAFVPVTGSSVPGKAKGKGKGKPDKVAKPKKEKPDKPPKKPHKPKDHKPATNNVHYSGQATLVYLTNGLMEPSTIYLGDTGPLPGAGGTLEVIVGPTNISSLELGMGRAYTTGGGNEARSEASIQDFAFTFHTTNNEIHEVAFSLLTIEATATCHADGTVTVASQSTIENLTFDGAAVEVTGEPNQTLAFPSGALVINFQQGTTTGNSGEVLAAGLVIALEGCMHGGIGIVHADIVCRGGVIPPSVECDRITGGGFILTPSGDKGTLAVGGGIRRGVPVGHLNYIDHGTGMHVRSTSVASYSAGEGDIRQIVYNVSIDGESGTATVLVADRGEPGVNDLFEVSLSNGYRAGGDLGGDGPGGGNIQLHKCPPGWRR